MHQIGKKKKKTHLPHLEVALLKTPAWLFWCILLTKEILLVKGFVH